MPRWLRARVLTGGEGAGGREADRAAGRRRLNRIVAASLSAPILEFERIQQLSQLASSANARTVIMGNGGARVVTTPSAR